MGWCSNSIARRNCVNNQGFLIFCSWQRTGGSCTILYVHVHVLIGGHFTWIQSQQSSRSSTRCSLLGFGYVHLKEMSNLFRSCSRPQETRDYVHSDFLIWNFCFPYFSVATDVPPELMSMERKRVEHRKPSNQNHNVRSGCWEKELACCWPRKSW